MQNSNLFYWITLGAYCLAYYLTAGLAINVAYHRCLSHRAFKLWKPLERILVTLGLPAGTPIQWAGNHRFHHQHTDLKADPHSPVQAGFWYAHVGWYLGTGNAVVCFFYATAGPIRTIYDSWNRPRTNQEYNHLAPDVAADKYYNFISRPLPFMLACWGHVLLFFGIAWAVWGVTGLVALFVTLAILYNLGDAIDSIAHIYGGRPFAATHFARNNRTLAYLTFGEGWHANHHVFPGSAKHGLLRGQFDGAWKIICLLKQIGLVTEIRTPTAQQISAKLIQSQENE